MHGFIPLMSKRLQSGLGGNKALGKARASASASGSYFSTLSWFSKVEKTVVLAAEKITEHIRNSLLSNAQATLSHALLKYQLRRWTARGKHRSWTEADKRICKQRCHTSKVWPCGTPTPEWRHRLQRADSHVFQFWSGDHTPIWLTHCSR